MNRTRLFHPDLDVRKVEIPDKTSYACCISMNNPVASSTLVGFLSGCKMSARALYAFFNSREDAEDATPRSS